MERQYKIIMAIVLAAVALLGMYISAETENEDASALLRGDQNLRQRQLSQAIDPKTVTAKGDNPSDPKTETSKDIQRQPLANVTFPQPADVDLIVNWPSQTGQKPPYKSRVQYLRDENDIVKRGQKGSCGGTLDVFAWIMDRVNGINGCLMIAYGELIHLHREGDFVDVATGSYYDDDIDTWATVDTIVHIASLELEMFRRFGWTIRFFVLPNGYVTFAQIVSACGHAVTLKPGKAVADHPCIELYPIVNTPDGRVRDLWQGYSYSENKIFPLQKKSLVSAGSPHTLELQLPSQPTQLLECLYGNWKVPSGMHARMGRKC